MKKESRVQEKAEADYLGDVTKVVDTVRASGIMRSIDDFASAVEALLADDPDSPTVVRTKDRVTIPLDSGYRGALPCKSRRLNGTGRPCCKS